MMRASVNSGTTDLSNIAGSRGPGPRIDQMLFKSKLSRMKSLLETQRAYSQTRGYVNPRDMDHKLHEFEKEIAELAKNCTDEQLIQEFEKILEETDKFIADVEKAYLHVG